MNAWILYHFNPLCANQVWRWSGKINERVPVLFWYRFPSRRTVIHFGFSTSSSEESEAVSQAPKKFKILASNHCGVGNKPGGSTKPLPRVRAAQPAYMAADATGFGSSGAAPAGRYSNPSATGMPGEASTGGMANTDAVPAVDDTATAASGVTGGNDGRPPGGPPNHSGALDSRGWQVLKTVDEADFNRRSQFKFWTVEEEKRGHFHCYGLEIYSSVGNEIVSVENILMWEKKDALPEGPSISWPLATRNPGMINN